MKISHNVSAQTISWVKSNQTLLDECSSIANLYYPERLSEFQCLLTNVNLGGGVIIGYSSNTLFLPSFHAQNVICTKYVNKWTETDDTIVCDCGVSVSKLSKYAVENGYVGFEGLTDLPGTIAAGVYGNCGCRGCSVLSLVRSFSIMDETGAVKEYTVNDLKPTYRSTTLKRGEIKGIILQVTLNKVQGNADELQKVADKNHAIRKVEQPSGVNNLGTTFNGGSLPTFKGSLLHKIERLIQVVIRTKDTRKSYPRLLKLIGKGKFAPYTYYWNRYMFLDVKAHELFPEYIEFVNSLYCDARLEIEIRK